MRFASLAPIGLVELLRAAFGYRQRIPVVTRVVAGELNDLADVITGMAKRPGHRQRHRMWLAADRHGFFEIRGS